MRELKELTKKGLGLSGFTLAEVLITLSIIGIVAAMTIPNLSSSKNKQVYITGAKKAYATMSEAYDRSIIDNGKIDKWDLSTNGSSDGAENILQNLVPYLKVIDNCGTATGCMDYDTNYLNSAAWPVNVSSTVARAILADGSILAVSSYGTDCLSVGGIHNACSSISIDINGEQKPNTLGKDIFPFYITNNFGVLPIGFPEDTHYHPYTTHCNTGNQGESCTYQVVVKGNMDYLN